MAVPFTCLVMLSTLAGHVRGVIRPREPAALERMTRARPLISAPIIELQNSPPTTAAKIQADKRGELPGRDAPRDSMLWPRLANQRFPNHIKMLRKLTRTMPDKQLVNPDDLGPTSPANNPDPTAADSPSHEPRQAARHPFDSPIAAAPPPRTMPLEYNQLCSLYYEWFQTPHPGALPVRLHRPPRENKHSAVAGVHVNSRYVAGMTLDD